MYVNKWCLRMKKKKREKRNEAKHKYCKIENEWRWRDERNVFFFYCLEIVTFSSNTVDPSLTLFIRLISMQIFLSLLIFFSSLQFLAFFSFALLSLFINICFVFSTASKWALPEHEKNTKKAFKLTRNLNRNEWKIIRMKIC